MAPIVFFVFAICFSHIHQGTLSLDGIRYAHIASGVLTRGEMYPLWDEFRGEYYGNKPPFLFWLLAFLFKLFGFSTFIAKLPGAVAASCALICFYSLVKKQFNHRTAVFAVGLLSLNPLFFRAVVDLSYEGIVLLGGILILGAALQLGTPSAKGTISRTLSIAALLFAISKPAYLIVPATSLVLFAWQRGLLRALFVRTMLFPIAIFITVTALPFVLGPSAQFSTAVSNQVFRPLTIPNGLGSNLLVWAKVWFGYLTPLSLITTALLLYSPLRRSLAAHPLAASLALWAAPVIPIVLFIDARGPYLFVPLLGIALLAALFLEARLAMVQEQKIEQAVLGIGALAILLPLVGVPLHLIDPVLIPLLRSRSVVDVVCIDGGKSPIDLAAQRRAAMVVTLYTGRKMPTLSSDEVSLESIPPGTAIGAERRCAAQLLGREGIAQIATWSGASLFVTNEHLAKAPRARPDLSLASDPIRFH